MTVTRFSKSNINQLDFWKLTKNIYLISVGPLIEIYAGLRSKNIPLAACLLWGFVVQILVLTGLDFLIFRWFGFDFCYPENIFFTWIYKTVVSTSGFWLWGCYQVLLKIILIRRLTEVFSNAGLKSAMKRLPSFIFDKPIDQWARKMRVKRNGLTKNNFLEAKESIESGLQIYVDDIKENRRSGTIDIFYAHRELERHIEFDSKFKIPRGSFIIGKTRSTNLTANLAEVPHLLIAGETGGGKSTYLRQLITTLYLTNKNYKFELVDLKGGLELQLFENLPRVRVYDSAEQAVRVLKRLNDTYIEGRKKLFKANSCNGIDSFLAIDPKDRTFPKNEQFLVANDRFICVIDEAFDLFMKGDKVQSQQAQEARTHANKIAAQGRALGIHLVIGTQRPDRNSVDPLTKANLPGRLCFSMANNVSSMTILDCKRGADIPSENKGRAIWKAGKDMNEVQTPYLSEANALKLLEPYKLKRPSETCSSSTAVTPESRATDCYPKSQSRREFS